MATRFRFNAKKCFLTYSQCPADKQLLFDFLNKFGTGLKNYCIAQEKHEDGNFHLHAFCEWNKTLDTKNQYFFDLVDAGKVYHPNLKNVKNGKADLRNIINYCHKSDKEPLSNMDVEQYNQLTKDEKADAKRIAFREAIDAETPEEVHKKIADADPVTYVKSFNNISALANTKIKKRKRVLKTYPDNWANVPEQFTEWAEQIGKDKDRCNLLIVIGKTNTGKTTWFRKLGNHAYLSGEFSLTPFESDFDYTVLDDVNWEYFATKDVTFRNMYLGKDEATLTDKYKRKTDVIFQGKPCVIITNNVPRQIAWLEQIFKQESYEDQVVWVEVNQTLFDTDHSVPCTPGQEDTESQEEPLAKYPKI